MNLQEKSKELFEIQQKIAKMEKAYKEVVDPLKAQRDTVQIEVMQGFKELGTATMRYPFATVSLAVRKTAQIESEGKVIAWLKKKKLMKEYTAVRLTEQFDALAKESIKKGEIIDGVVVRETEYLSISTANEEKDRRKVVTD